MEQSRLIRVDGETLGIAHTNYYFWSFIEFVHIVFTHQDENGGEKQDEEKDEPKQEE